MKLLVAGDFVPFGRVAKSIENGDYSCFDEIRTITANVDYSIVNFECPVVSRDAKPIVKVGPNLKTTSNAVKAIANAGFKGVTLANNHLRDYGDVGVEDTIAALKRNSIDYVGAGTNLYKSRDVLYRTIGKETLAIINCCEHEFSVATINRAGANPLNLAKQYNAIKEARGKANYVVVITHGGHENYQLPSPRMQETYRFFIDAGADAVINHHQHCYSGYELYSEKPIFYGLGNLCFDTLFKSTPSTWYEGYMVELCFDCGKIEFRVVPYKQCDKEPIVKLLKPDAFNERITELDSIISDSSLLEKNFYELCDKRGKTSLVSTLSPFKSKYLLGLIKRNLFPSFISRGKLLKAYPYINCEAHRDVLLNTLNMELDK